MNNTKRHIVPYKFRGLPCDITTDDKLWCISGGYNGGGGILEWCYDERDARDLVKVMIRSATVFTSLRVHKYME